MSRMRYIISILGVAVLLVVLAACGNVKSSSVPSSVDGPSINTVTQPASVIEPVVETPSGSPLMSIIFEEVNYTFEDVRSVTPGESTTFGSTESRSTLPTWSS